MLPYFSFPHVLGMVFSAISITAAYVAFRKFQLDIRFGRGILAIMIVLEIAAYVHSYGIAGQPFDIGYSLPLYHCTVGLYAVMLAMAFGNRVCFEIGAFHVLAFIPISLLYPMLLDQSHPEFYAFLFFFFARKTLGIIGVMALIMLYGAKFRISFLRLVGWSQAIIVFHVLVNFALGAFGIESNYFLVMANPSQLEFLDADTWGGYFVKYELVMVGLYLVTFPAFRSFSTGLLRMERA